MNSKESKKNKNKSVLCDKIILIINNDGYKSAWKASVKLSIKSLFRWYKSICYFTGRENLINGIKQFKELPEGVVLDIGCGNKPYRRYFSGNIKNYIGLDLAYSQEVDIIADAIYLPILSQTFDTVLCFNALNVFKNPFTFFREANRVLTSHDSQLEGLYLKRDLIDLMDAYNGGGFMQWKLVIVGDAGH